MANNSGKNSGGPRRLGPEQAKKSPGAQRRQARAQRQSSKRIGWIIVGVVVIALLGVLLPKVFSSSPANNSTTVDVTGQHPSLASAAMVDPVVTVPASVFDSIGVRGQAAPFIVTKGQTPLIINAKPAFVYVGGEYCPFCAAMRWSMVAALSRFGTFSKLKVTSSAPTDGNIPTFSFLGSTYTSKYITFSPYEESDRQQNPLQIPPANIQKLYAKYDGTGTTGTIFSPGGTGIPFLDVANRYVSAGDPPSVASFVGSADNGPLVNGGPGTIAIAQAVHDPNSSVGKGIGASNFIVMANFISAAICNSDGGQPSTVCNSPGVKAAAAVLAKATPIG